MEDRVIFGLMMVLFNGCGVPSFLQGQKRIGVMRIVFGVLSLGVLMVFNTIDGVKLGVKILRMSDAEYAEKKGTFDTGTPAA